MDVKRIGIVWVLIFVILSAAKEVFSGYLVQNIDPLFLVLVCFFPIALCFTLYQFLTTPKQLLIQQIKSNVTSVIFLNISTCCSWIGSFYALKYIEPSIANAINSSVGPLITTIILLIGGQCVPRLKIISSLGIIFSIIFMSIVTYKGESGIGTISHEHFFVGLFFCLLTGTSIVGNTLFSKQLSRNGLSTSFVLSIRFYFMLLLILGIYLRSSLPQDWTILAENWGNILLLTVFGIMLPLYCLQKGIEKTEPIIIAFLIVLVPVFVYLFEFFDSRLILSPYTLIGIILNIILVILGLIKRNEN